MGRPKLEGSLDETLQQHKELDVQVKTLRQFLADEQPELGGKASHAWAAALTQHITKLHAKLCRHFSHEEETGTFEELAERNPRASGRIEKLRGEHGEILSGIRQVMMDTLCFSEGRCPEDPNLSGRIVRLLDQLKSHERRENELIQGALYEDIGTKD